jgi:hypothetical protein
MLLYRLAILESMRKRDITLVQVAMLILRISSLLSWFIAILKSFRSMDPVNTV